MELNTLHNLVAQAKLALNQSNTIDNLEKNRIKFLGKNGYINKQLQILCVNKLHIKSKLMIFINQAKKDIYELYIKQREILQSKIINQSLATETLDITLPGRLSDIGALHPISNIIEHVKKFFNHLGFIMIHGPEIENDYFNFDALNVPVDHPSRDEHDTFWFDTKRLLRTHTSGMQIRAMINKSPPMRVISIGKVYRKDYDKDHTPMFHQIEGLMIDSNINFSNLKQILYNFLFFFFSKDIHLRFRPSYFPFTEPSAEIDIIEEKSKNWIELLGCGMIHPKVLHNVNIDSTQFSGFAFGIGIERLAMLLYNITDIRVFFENDLQFLNQFQ